MQQNWISRIGAIAIVVGTALNGGVAGAAGRSPTSAPAAIAPMTPPLPRLETLPSAAWELAQVGQCRQTKRLERVYTRPSLTSNRVMDLRSGTSVELGGRVNEPEFGWIRINAPVDGYVIATFLATCGTTSPLPSPGSGNCGIAQTDLTINTGPSTETFTLSGLSFRQGFRIIGAAVSQTAPASQRGRRWIPIDRYGVTGWISETSPGGTPGNIRRVSCGTIGL